MYLKEHINKFKGLYLIILSWPALGFFVPSNAVVAWAVLSFIFILRTQDYTKIFLALAATLLFSDSYLEPLAFAATAKIAVIVLLFLYVISNYSAFADFENKLFKFFLPFLLFAISASFWSNQFFMSFQKSLSYSIVFFVVPLFFQRAKTENKFFSRDLINAYAVFLFAGILLWVINPIAGTLAERFRGLMGNPNGMGTLLTVLGMLAYILQTQNRQLKEMDKVSWIFFLLMFAPSLLLCGSRTALFAIGLFLLFTKLRYFSNVGTLILFTIVLFSYNYLLTKLPSILMSLGLEEYLRVDTLEEGSGRFVAWNFAWEQIQNKFFFGGGFGYTEFLYKEYYRYLSQLGHEGNAHNSYLTLWLDTGFIGIILFVYGLVRTIIVSAAKFFYALPVFYSALFSANFESWLAASLNPFTSLLLITWTVITQPEEIPSEEEELQLENPT